MSFPFTLDVTGFLVSFWRLVPLKHIKRVTWCSLEYQTKDESNEWVGLCGTQRRREHKELYIWYLNFVNYWNMKLHDSFRILKPFRKRLSLAWNWSVFSSWSIYVYKFNSYTKAKLSRNQGIVQLLYLSV